MDTASLGTTAHGALVMDVALEYLKFVRHHFLAKVQRTTPSGRQQSAILLLIPDAVCLLSNRGGLHTYIPLSQLVALTVFPRARVCFHGKKRHDVLIACTQQPRLVSAITQLYLGLTGSALPVHQDEGAPSLDRLQLRPSADYHPSVPSALVRALRDAALSCASYGATNAAAALVDPLQEHAKQAHPTAHGPSGGDGSQPHAVVDEGNVLRGSSSDAPHLTERSLLGHGTSSPLPSHASHRAAKLLRGPVAGASHPSPLFADPASGATILVMEAAASATVLTVPVYRSLWEYLSAVVAQLPGATEAPTARIRCVEHPGTTLTINSQLLHQTMALFAEAHPHMVTLQKRATDEGHHFDGSVLWESMSHGKNR